MMSLEEIELNINQAKAFYQRRLGQKNIIESKINTLTQEVNNSRNLQEKNNQISSLLQKAAELSRDSIKTHLELICTMALKHVFDKDIEFVIDIQDSRGRAEAEFFIQYKSGNDIIKVKPSDASGGGVIDVLSMALRFAFLEVLKDPIIQGPILLDEPGKMVSEIASGKMSNLIKELNVSFGRQTIMSTHNDQYGACADKEIRVMMTNGVSRIEENKVFDIGIEEDEII